MGNDGGGGAGIGAALVVIFVSLFCAVCILIICFSVCVYESSSNYSSGISQSQKKRLLAKVQNEVVIPVNGSVVAKQEPSSLTSDLEYCSGGSSCKDPYHCVAPQEQHIVYTT